MKILKHVSNLGRYYKGRSDIGVDSFVKVASYQAVLLYFALKFIINEIIFRYDYYIATLEEDEAFKDILLIDLERINDQMKHVLLNKYFDLLGVGIKTTLFELEMQS